MSLFTGLLQDPEHTPYRCLKACMMAEGACLMSNVVFIELLSVLFERNGNIDKPSKPVCACMCLYEKRGCGRARCL
jgi:hypothetical protein